MPSPGNKGGQGRKKARRMRRSTTVKEFKGISHKSVWFSLEMEANRALNDKHKSSYAE